jgi:hypothetical protein
MKQWFAIFLSAMLMLFSTQALSQNWPSFRGPNASGIANGQNPPIEWKMVALDKQKSELILF